MQFVFPWFLFALLALAVPIIVHLFNFRRYKTVYFSNVKFLRDVKEETSSRSKLKHLLVLAARLLALLFLVLAFAQPYFPNKNTKASTGKKYVSVFIDNSFSMNAVADGKSLLEKAKQTAKEIARSYSADDRFQLLTNDFEGKHQRLVGKEEFTTMVDEVEASAAVRELQEITKRQRDALSRENGKNQTAYLLSDFQKNMSGFVPDSTINYNLIPLAGDAAANVYIDTVWFNEPVQILNRQVTLIVKVSNTGEKTNENNRLVLKLNGLTKVMADFRVEANSFVYDTLSFLITQSGFNKAELQIQDYPITYDDTYFLAFDVIEKLKVITLSDNGFNQFTDALFKDQPEFDYTTASASAFDINKIKEAQLVILDNVRAVSSSLTAALNSFVAEGGSVAMFPAPQCDVESYNRLLTGMKASPISDFSEQPQDIATINLQQPVFKDVFDGVPQNMGLPRAKKYYRFTSSIGSNEEAILTLKDGSAFFSRYSYQRGSLYVCGSPINQNFSDLPVHAVFVPLLYKMAVLDLQSSASAYFIGSKKRIETEAPKGTTDKVYKISGEGIEFIPEQFAAGNKILLGLNNPIGKSGFYNLSLNGNDTASVLALNFDRKESDMKFLNADDLKTAYPQQNLQVVNGASVDVATVVKELDRGTALWKWCLLLTLVFLAAEITLLRFWKV